MVRQSVLGRDSVRLLAAARVFFATAALIAPYFDPHGGLNVDFHLVIVAYVLIGVVFAVTQSGVGRPALAAAMHGLDLAFATVMVRSPSGAGFFLILATFCLLSSIIQWRWRAALVTGSYLLAIYLLAVSLDLVSTERMTIRTVYLALAPLGLALASRQADAARARLLKLARWSSGRYNASEDAVLRVFAHAADVLDAESVEVYFQEADQPTAIHATYVRSSDTLSQTPCDRLPDQTTATSLRQQPFVMINRKRGLCITYAGLKRVQDPVSGFALPDQSGIVASAAFAGEFCNGRLFACGLPNWRWDQIVLVDIVASHVRSRLEGRSLRDKTARVTADLERMRLSRDLHDGILQTLTAARLQLNALSKDAPDFAQRLRVVADILQDEQQKLRGFVESSRSVPADAVHVTRIGERIGMVAEHWRLRADVEIDGTGAYVSDALYREVHFIVGEAIANSARHGRATAIRAQVTCGDGRFVLVLSEAGRRAGPQGRPDLPAAQSRRKNP